MPQAVNLAIAQIRPRKGDYARNLARIGDLMAQAASLDPPPQVLHLAETVLSGYFVEGGVRELAVSAGTLATQLNDLFRKRVAGARTMDVVVGFYEIWHNTLHNSAICVTVGGPDPVIRHVHRKMYLPTYGLFDEERFVERGTEIRSFESGWGRGALLICEDAWHSLSGTVAALDGAQFILLSAAAPARGVWPRGDDTPGPYTLNRWERLARDIAEEHGVFVSLAHMVGSEGGKLFAGGSLIVGPRGDVLARAPLFEEAILSVTVDVGDITRARADMPLLSDLETVLPRVLENIRAIDAGTPARLSYSTDGTHSSHAHGPRDKERAIERAEPGRENVTVVRTDCELAGSPQPLEINAPFAVEMLVNFIREELRRRGFNRVVIGLSGGVDSSVTAFLAARALGAENVIGVRLPYRNSSRESLSHADLVIDQLGIVGKTVDISAAVDGYLASVPDASPARRGNVMSRVRMIALFDLSAEYGALPLGTGNKTERLLGYFTWHADDSPPVNPLGDLYKTQVWELARHLGVPAVIVEKPATADLIEGQTDEGDLGVSYAVADRVLNWLLSGYTPAEMLLRGFTESEVNTVAARLAATHWKRRLPTVAMLSPTAIGESYLRPVDY